MICMISLSLTSSKSETPYRQHLIWAPFSIVWLPTNLPNLGIYTQKNMIICDTLAIVGILPKPSSPLKPKGKDRLPVSQPSWLSAAKMLVSGR